MRYFLDFDRTVFDTDSFKREFAKRPPVPELFRQFGFVIREFFNPTRSLPKRHLFERTLGTYASHGRFIFIPEELRKYLYKDAIEFLLQHGHETTIVTYGVRAFITAKVANALSDLPLNDIVYTHKRKGSVIKRLIKERTGPFIFVDDAHFQLLSVSRYCPNVEIYEMRRDNREPDGRWPVIHALNELPELPPLVEASDIDLRTAKVAAIINTASGSYNEGVEHNMEILLRSAGVTELRMWTRGPGEIDKAFREAKAYAPDILIVLGGDGTIRVGAEACTAQGPFLIPLPGGTMNMLPKTLYGARSWDEALRDTLQLPLIRSISGGSANGKQFFIAAIAGAPALWAEVREMVREGDIKGAFNTGKRVLGHMLATKVRYQFSDDKKGEADAVAVICPLISDVMHDRAQALEAAVVTLENVGAVLKLASAAAFGQWREDSRVAVEETTRVTFEADEDIPIILDGETMEFGKRVDVTFIPVAFKVLVPRT